MNHKSAPRERNTGASIKNAQTTSSQKTRLARNYLEQRLESERGYSGRVIYDRTNKALIQFRVKEGAIAVLQDGRLDIFEMPVKKYDADASLPLEFDTVNVESIRIEDVTCCKRCHEWKKAAKGIRTCRCGGYLVPRKRFSTQETESWDTEFLEVRFAQKDIRNAQRIDRKPRRPGRIATAGITPKIAGMSSRTAEARPHKEMLLIPKGDEVRGIPVRSVRSCELVFSAKITSQDKQASQMQRSGLIKEILDDIKEDASACDERFASDAAGFIRNTAPEEAEEMMRCWNRVPMTAARRPRGISERQTNCLAKKSQNQHESEKREVKKKGSRQCGA